MDYSIGIGAVNFKPPLSTTAAAATARSSQQQPISQSHPHPSPPSPLPSPSTTATTAASASASAAAAAPESTAASLPPLPSPRPGHLARSNSTTATPVTTRSRLFSHFRSGSNSSASSSTRTNGSQSSHPLSHDFTPRQASSVSSALHSAASAAVGSLTSASSRVDYQHRSAERMPASNAAGRYYKDKELPTTPRLETLDTSARHLQLAASATTEPSSAHTPVSATAPATPSLEPPPPRLQQTKTFPTIVQTATPSATTYSLSAFAALSAANHERRAFGQQHAMMGPEPGALSRSSAFPRTDSVSSASGATSMSARTMQSSEAPSSIDSTAHQLRPFVVRNGRTYVSDPSLPYPLPVDLPEIHRQTLRTLLLYQLFGSPVCSPALISNPPSRVLEVGCGSGFWSMTCHRYYARHGHVDISFTGMDVAPIAPGASGRGTSTNSSNNRPASSLHPDGRPDRDMKWRFVQHDMRRLPWPFQDGEFDLVMVKDMSLAVPNNLQQVMMDEYIRVLAPGGTIEIWESDHTLRMLRPHVPDQSAQPTSREESDADDGDDNASNSSEEDENKLTANLGAYTMTSNTPLSAPTNNFLLEYNAWLSKALEARSLSPVPCTLIGPALFQEAEVLTSPGSRRLAIPLSEVRWEREGVGGVVTKDGKSYIATRGKGKGGKDAPAGVKGLKPGPAALRRTALLSVVQMIQSLEPLIRDISGKSQDEWDNWLGKLMNDLVKENGTSWGECLEVGAWWAKKRT